MAKRREAPVVGEPYNFGCRTIVPTYVRDSAKPTKNGMCVTRDGPLATENWEMAGWYVEADGNRMFIPMDEE